MARPQPQPTLTQSPQGYLNYEHIGQFIDSQRQQLAGSSDVARREIVKNLLMKTEDAQGMSPAELDEWTMDILAQKQLATPGPQITTGGTPPSMMEQFKSGLQNYALATPLPVAGESGGAYVGGYVGGVPGGIVGSMAGSTAGYLANVGLDLEDYSTLGLTTAAISPLLGRAASAGTKRLIGASKAARLAFKTQLEEEISTIRQQYEYAHDVYMANFPKASIMAQRKNLQATADAAKTLHRQFQEDAITLQARHAIDAKDFTKNVPTLPIDTIRARYDHLATLTNITIPDTNIRQVQSTLGRANALIATVAPGFQDALESRVSQQAATPTAQGVSYGLGVPVIGPEQLPTEVSFPAIVESIKKLGQTAQRLVGSNDPAAAGQRRVLYILKNELIQSLDDIAAASHAGEQAVNALRQNNAQFSKLMTVQEFGDFLADHFTPVTEKMIAEGRTGALHSGDQLLLARTALAALESEEQKQLRDNLTKHGLLGNIRAGLQQMQGQLERVAKEQANQANIRRTALRDIRNLPKPEPPPAAPHPDQIAALEAQMPDVTLSSPYALSRIAALGGAFTASMLGGHGITTSAITSGLVYVPYFAAHMLTGNKTTREMLVNILQESKKSTGELVFNANVAGALGAFVGTSLRQAKEMFAPQVQDKYNAKFEKP